MKKLGIIAEFNPFHEGHKYFIEEARALTGAEAVIAVMSGDFTQRGYPAVYDKWKRAEDAVRQGVNLIFELPVCCACSSAEFFAKGAVNLLEGTGCIDFLAFGSESGDLGALKKTADILQNRREEIHQAIRGKIKKGRTYPAARAEAVAEAGFAEESRLLRMPNDILAIEYLKQLRTMEPFTVKRRGMGHHQSASEIRQALRESEGNRLSFMEDNYYRLLSGRILALSEEEFSHSFSAEGGLGNKLKKEIRYAENLEELIDRVKSKAYTRTRISRLLAHTVLGLTDERMKAPRLYLRVLAFDERGAEVLREMRKQGTASLPILTNINREAGNYPEIAETLGLDIFASDLYNLISGNNLYLNSDYVKRPGIVQQKGCRVAESS